MDGQRTSAASTGRVEAPRPLIAAAFACGVLTGAILGTLLAPAEGRKSRRWVRDQAASARTRTVQSARNRREQLHAFIKRHGIIGLAGRTNATPSA